MQITDTLLHLIGMGVMVLLAFVGLKLNNTALRIDNKIDKVAGEIRSHMAVDDAQFEAINHHFESTDKSVSRLEDVVFFQKHPRA